MANHAGIDAAKRVVRKAIEMEEAGGQGMGRLRSRLGEALQVADDGDAVTHLRCAQAALGRLDLGRGNLECVAEEVLTAARSLGHVVAALAEVSH